MGRELITILISALGLIITGLATWVTQKLIRLLNSKIAGVELRKNIDVIEQIILKAIHATEQTFVNEQKQKDNWTKQSQELAMLRTVDTAKVMLSDSILAFINTYYGDIDEWLKAQVEASIYSLKDK